MAPPGLALSVRLRPAITPMCARQPSPGGCPTRRSPPPTATAKAHVGRLLAKLAARDRAQLVVHAYEAGVVVLGA